MATASCSCQSSLNAACCSSRRAVVRSGPGETGQDEPVPIWICDRHTPLVPVGIAGGDPGAARVDQPADHVLIDVAAYVQDQQVFLGGRGWCRAARIADEFKMPGGIRPADHQQLMAAFCCVVKPEQHVESQ